MQKLRKNALLVSKLPKVRLNVEVPRQELREVRPPRIPLAKVEKFKIGTAKIERENVPYWQTSLRINL